MTDAGFFAAELVLISFSAVFAVKAARQLWRDLKQNIRAKRALEDEVLREAKADGALRALIAHAAGSPEQMNKAVEVITLAAERLPEEDAKVVRSALLLGQYQHYTGYCETIARHVNQRLLKEAAAL